MTGPLTPSDRRMRPSASAIGLSVLVFVAGLALFDMIGEMVLALSSTNGPGGFLREVLGGILSPPRDGWLTVTATGWLPGPNMVLMTALVLALGLGLSGAALAGATRLGALALLLALGVPLVAWSPLALGVIGAQAMFLLLDRGGRGSEALLQMVRLVGMLTVVVLLWSVPAALAVSLIAVALAPSAMLTLSRPLAAPRWAAPQQTTEADTAADDAPPSLAPLVDGPADLAPSVDQPAPVGVDAPTQTGAAPSHPSGPFGDDPVASLSQLTPAAALMSTARSALAAGEAAVLVLVRLDGLAGIAEHLGIVGGEALFAQATARLEAALPAGSLLSWMGDETFTALMPADAVDDPEALLAALAAPFSADLVVDGRAVSMEDALHVDVLSLTDDTLSELARWADAAPA